MKKFKVDARGLDCPKPLLRTKTALEQEEFDTITVLVSTVPARENIIRFLKHSNLESVEWRELEDGEFSISAIRGEGSETEQSSPSAPAQENKQEASGKTVLIASSCMGTGKKELGKLLMKGYIYTLTQLDELPRCVIFMNTGVKLTLEGSESLEDLKVLEEKGVDLKVCGTCLDFLNVREQMKIGTISNMYDIASQLHSPGDVVSFS